MAKLVKRAGAIIIKDKKVLVARAKDLGAIFLPPGGAVEKSETMEQALIREIFEELKIVINESDIEIFNRHFKKADQDEDFDLQLDAFIIKKWTGEITPDNEIEEIVWIESTNKQKIKLGSIFESEILPKLKAQNLID